MNDTEKREAIPSHPRGSENVSQEAVFFLETVLPNAQDLFHVRQKPIDEIKGSCLVALDTNVLLMPYEMDKFSLVEISKVYKQLSMQNRLIVPAQAAREFIKNRATKVGNIVNHLRDLASKSTPPLKRKIGFLETQEKYIGMKKVSDQIDVLSKKFREYANSLADMLSTEVGNDPVSLEYNTIFVGCVKDLSLDQKEKKEFVRELSHRYKLKIPPGYMDAKKPDGGSGDLLIWKTILKEGKEKQRDLIFVTVEEKQDWWVQSHGAFQPRIELLEEYRSFTGGHSIHIIRLSHLLQIYSADEKAVNETRRIEEANTANYILEANTGRYILSSGTSKEKATAISNQRDAILAELASIEREIAATEDHLQYVVRGSSDALAEEAYRALAELRAIKQNYLGRLALIEAKSP